MVVLPHCRLEMKNFPGMKLLTPCLVHLDGSFMEKFMGNRKLLSSAIGFARNFAIGNCKLEKKRSVLTFLLHSDCVQMYLLYLKLQSNYLPHISVVSSVVLGLDVASRYVRMGIYV